MAAMITVTSLHHPHTAGMLVLGLERPDLDLYKVT